MTVVTLTGKLLSDRRCTTSVEFAVVGSTFMLTIYCMIIFGVHLLTQGALDAATQSAAREIQIGNFRGSSASTTRQFICDQMPGLGVTCANIQIYAISGATFGSLPPATVSGSTMSPTTFNTGTGLARVLLQTAYRSPFAIPLAGLADLTVTSTIAFQNEP